jgi:ribonuclease HI
MYYAVARGHRTGVFTSWEEASQAVNNYPNAIYRMFASREEAERFLNPGKTQSVTTSSPVQIPTNRIVIYTDGSSKDNIGGYGAVVMFPDTTKRNFCGRVPSERCTNQMAELYAIYFAVHNFPGPLTIYTDSKYAIGCLRDWTPRWIKDNWKEVANRNIIEPCYQLIQTRDVAFQHVFAHRGDLNNEAADRLAKLGRTRIGGPFEVADNRSDTVSNLFARPSQDQNIRTISTGQ